MNADDVGSAVNETLRVLAPEVDRDWHVRAGSLEWTCWQTAEHIAHDLLAYATQVVGSPTSSYLPLDLMVREGTPPRAALDVVEACGRLLSVTVASADPSSRAWHWGATDPGGFAALGVNETLVHTFDITQGLGIEWLPPAGLCRDVLARLFPPPPPGVDLARALLWSTGRIALEDHPRLDRWVAKAAR